LGSIMELQDTNHEELAKDLLTIVNMLIEKQNGRNKKEGGIISLNPGIRSGYNSRRNIVKFCRNIFSRLSKLGVYYDKYQSQSTK
ncbi:21591_t:CDS:2, partial [Gigaspora rosea]